MWHVIWIRCCLRLQTRGRSLCALTSRQYLPEKLDTPLDLDDLMQSGVVLAILLSPSSRWDIVFSHIWELVLKGDGRVMSSDKVDLVGLASKTMCDGRRHRITFFGKGWRPWRNSSQYTLVVTSFCRNPWSRQMTAGRSQ